MSRSLSPLPIKLEPNDMVGWVKIWSGKSLHEAALVKQLLDSNEIPVIQLDKQDSSYLFGDIEIHVRHDDVLKAKHLFEQRNSDNE